MRAITWTINTDICYQIAKGTAKIITTTLLIPDVMMTRQVAPKVRRHKNNYCKRYKCSTRIATKRSYNSLTVWICRSAQRVTNEAPQRSTMRIDSDSFPIGIDTFCSRTISNNVDHFRQIRPATGTILKGIGKDPVKVLGTGTIRWTIEDDVGKNHNIVIPNALYAPRIPICLLSPQHWAQEQNNEQPDGITFETASNTATLRWNQRKSSRTIQYSPQNTPTIMSAPGATRFAAMQSLHDNRNDTLQHHKVTCKQEHGQSCECEGGCTLTSEASAYKEEHMTQVFAPPLPLEQKALTKQVNQDQANDPQMELLRWHYRLAHTSFHKLKLYSHLGLIPKRLAHVTPPKCAGCIYGAMTKKPWRTKGPQGKGKLKLTDHPGQCISVDQLQSTTPGFIAQLKGLLTRRRYTAATIFVDHYSGYSYVHLQPDMTSDSTVAAKEAFEAHSKELGVTIESYHADNGRFADNAFIEAVRLARQTISYCAAHAHFQNGKAEKRIRDLQEAARKQLLHAIARWPEVITFHLWPYALRHANNIRNNLPDSINGSSPLDRYSKSGVQANLSNFHAFGCPVYALHSSLQDGNSVPKCHSRSRLGVHLGQSPRHARTVSLVMNLTTGHVSPLFHVRHDEYFETVRPDAGNATTQSHWQQLAVLTNILPKATLRETRSIERKRTKEALPSDSDITLSEKPPTNKDLPTMLRRSTRTTRKPDLLTYSAEHDALHQCDYSTQEQMSDPIAFLSNQKDTLYYHEAMRAPDRDHFIEAMIQEVNTHVSKGHWNLIAKTEVPSNTKVLDAVWSMKRKRDILTQEVYKWKARLNVHGGQQQYGVNYYDTYSPVVQWQSIRLFLEMALLNKWHTRQIDFITAYPQADIEFDLYMKLPEASPTHQGTQRPMSCICARTCMGKNRQERCGMTTSHKV